MERESKTIWYPLVMGIMSGYIFSFLNYPKIAIITAIIVTYFLLIVIDIKNETKRCTNSK